MAWRFLLASCVAMSMMGTAWAADQTPKNPKARFDASYTVECRDVTPRGANEQDATDSLRTYQATFRFSVSIDGDETKIKEVFLEIQDKANKLRFVEFDATKLVPTTKGPITVETLHSAETTDSKSISAGGRIIGVAEQQGRAGVGNGLAGGDVNEKAATSGTIGAGGTLSRSQSGATRERNTYQREAPKEASFISGTISREHGVQFRLKPNPQDTLQGMKEITLKFKAPNGWHGDWVSVRCRANGQDGNDGPEYGERRLSIGMYLKGESTAQQEAELLGDAQMDIDKLEEPSPEQREAYVARLRSMKNNHSGQ